jgi:2-(1,2-epoxy-1,2-dihydrophenyl)acetyl-CoA isomerase
MAEALESTSGSLVLESRLDGVATLTLNRPERLNALDTALGDALLAALGRVSEDRSIRVVVLTGAGRGFCAGGDLQMLRDACQRDAVGEVENLLATGKKIVLRIAGMFKPVVAAVNGPAAGAGCNLALACDMRIASGAATFAESFARVGLFPDFGGTFFLPRLVGPARAAELLYTGETVAAVDAAAIGLVSRVVAHERLAQEVAATARRLAAAPPLTVRGIKQALFANHRAALEEALDEEIRRQMVCFRSRDFREGLAAFVAKREPHFLGG